MSEYLQVALAQRTTNQFKPQFDFFKKFMLFEQHSRKSFTQCKHIHVSKLSRHQAYLPLRKDSTNVSNTTFKDLIENHFSATEGTEECEVCQKECNYVQEKIMKGMLETIFRCKSKVTASQETTF